MFRRPYFGLAARLVAAFVGLSGGLLLAYSWLALRMAENTLKNELGDRLTAVARLAAADDKVQALPFAMRSEGGRIGEAARGRLAALVKGTEVANIVVADDQERVLIDAVGRHEWRDPAWLFRLDRAELKRVWRGAETSSQVYQGEDGGLYLSAYAPVWLGGKVLAVVGAEASAEFLENVRRMRRRFANVGLVMLAFAALLGWVSAQTVTRPLRELREAVDRIGRGDFTATTKVKAGHEVGELARAFNRMAQAINVRHEDILENMSNGLVAVDGNGIVAEVNRAAERLLGIRRDALLGTDFKRGLPRPLSQALAETLEGDEPLHGEKIALDRAGEAAGSGGQVILQVSTARLKAPDGELRGAELMFLDVTEIERLTEAFETQKRFAAIGEVAAEVAHQIRNPLGAMHAFADLLRSEISGNDKSREYLEDMLKEVTTMEGIVSKFLQYARPSRLELGELDVTEVLRGACREMQPEFDRAKVRLEIAAAQGLSGIRADAKIIHQALINLLRNALESCAPGGAVTARAFVQDGGVAVTIEDDGAGISPEVAGRLFAPFVTTKAKGTGLGLSLAKKFVEAHGGVIGLTALAKGARAEIRLPKAPPGMGV